MKSLKALSFSRLPFLMEGSKAKSMAVSGATQCKYTTDQRAECFYWNRQNKTSYSSPGQGIHTNQVIQFVHFSNMPTPFSYSIFWRCTLTVPNAAFSNTDF